MYFSDQSQLLNSVESNASEESESDAYAGSGDEYKPDSEEISESSENSDIDYIDTNNEINKLNSERELNMVSWQLKKISGDKHQVFSVR